MPCRPSEKHTRALVFMGIAKITASAERAGLDDYGLCIGTGW